MKLTLLGGGGFRTPRVYQAVIDASAPVRPDELVLYDTSLARMSVVRAVVAGLPVPGGMRVTYTDDLDEALRGADFVFSAIRVGGLEGRVADERVALDLGVLGQETTGPGGLAYALRTIPVMRAIARKTAMLAPAAYLINFTNPAGIVTEALRPILGDRVIGICDTPVGMLRRIGRLLGRPVTGFDYAGLNHLGWLRSVRTDRGEELPGILADDAMLASIEEARLMGPEWGRRLGALPNEYLYYYYYTREAVEHLRAGKTRGERILAEEGRFYEQAQASPARARELWEEATREREATYMAEAAQGDREQTDTEDGGYQKVALDIMAAITTGAETTLILNTANSGEGERAIIGALPADCVVEVPCRVDGDGVHPLPIAPVTGHMEGLLAWVKNVEQLTIQAAVEGRAELAWQAMALHPLVDSVNIGRELIDGYRAAHPGLAYLA